MLQGQPRDAPYHHRLPQETIFKAGQPCLLAVHYEGTHVLSPSGKFHPRILTGTPINVTNDLCIVAKDQDSLEQPVTGPCSQVTYGVCHSYSSSME